VRPYILLIAFIFLGHQRSFAQKNRVSTDQPFEIIIDSTLNQDSTYYISTFGYKGLPKSKVDYFRKNINIHQGANLSLKEQSKIHERFATVSDVKKYKLVQLEIKRYHVAG
jgi:hypothetical protein